MTEKSFRRMALILKKCIHYFTLLNPIFMNSSQRAQFLKLRCLFGFITLLQQHKIKWVKCCSLYYTKGPIGLGVFPSYQAGSALLEAADDSLHFSESSIHYNNLC